jgi:hypothetical protein
MPFFRVNGALMHLKLSGKAKNTKACREVIDLDGKKALCLGIGAFLCDHRMDDGKTCDRPLCDAHAMQVGPNRHLCHEHAAARTAALPELF